MNQTLKSLFAIVWLGSYWSGFQGQYFWAVGLALLAIFCGLSIRWSTLAGSLFGYFAPVSAILWALSVRFFQVDLAFAILFFVAAATALLLPGLAALDNEELDPQREPFIRTWWKKSLDSVQPEAQTDAPQEQTRGGDAGSRSALKARTTYAVFCVFCLLGGLLTEGALGAIAWIFAALFALMTVLTSGGD